jgi:diguanylate cyclase (GGDEF)-like protein
LLQALSDPDAPISKIADIVKADPAIVTKLLRAANSPAYGSRMPIETIDHAVVWLGKNAVTSLALSFTLADQSRLKGEAAHHYTAYWLRSVTQALSMEHLAGKFDPGSKDVSFVIGLLMDVGRLAMLQADATSYAAASARASREPGSIESIEREHFGITHWEMSAEILEQYSLPAAIVDSVRSHNLEIEDLREMQQRGDYLQIAAANVASATADFLGGANPFVYFERLVSLTTAVYDLSDDQIDEYLTAIRQRTDDTSDLFSTDISQMPSTGELLAAAAEQLSQLTHQKPSGEANAEPSSNEQPDLRLGDRISHLAEKKCVDPMTGAYTDDYFKGRLNRRVQDSGDHQTETGVLMVEADGIGRITNTQGPDACDAVLKRLAAVIRRSLGSGDVMARCGANRQRFLVLLDRSSVTRIDQLAEQIREATAAESLTNGDSKAPRLTASVGGTVIQGAPPADDGRYEEVLNKTAERALGKASQAGGDRVIVEKLVWSAA